MEKKKAKRQLVPRTHDFNSKTKSEFFGLFRSAIRRIWMYSKIRQEAVRNAKVAPNKYLCADCKECFKSNEIQVDHVHPCGSLKEFEDFTPVMSKMFQEDLSLLEVVCLECHKKRTKLER